MSHPEVREVSNYRELFGRLASTACNVGWHVEKHGDEWCDWYVVSKDQTLPVTRDILGSLWLIVRAMESEGWHFHRKLYDEYEVTACHDDLDANGIVIESADEAEAIALCVLAAASALAAQERLP